MGLEGALTVAKVDLSTRFIHYCLQCKLRCTVRDLKLSNCCTVEVRKILLFEKKKAKMLPTQHVFSHQHQYQAEPSWLHQQQAHHPPQHSGHSSHQHAQAQAAAAAAAMAQQNHYNRIITNNSNNVHGHSGHAMSSDSTMANGLEGNFSDENRRVLGWVAELLNGNSRETALMELSKKREQVPELALIIWHSFGKVPRREVSYTG